MRLLAELDVSALSALAAAIGDAEWARERWRQETFKTHAHTEVVPLVYDEDFRHEDPTRREAWPRFEAALEPVLDAVRAGLGEGYFLRVILTRLAPRASIPRHADGGLSLPFAHRVHAPLLTSDEVRFTVGETRRALRVGELWEINNLRPHSVVNAGDAPRVHLILDYVTPDLARRRAASLLARDILSG